MALPVVLITDWSVTPASASSAGSTRTWSWRSRWPQTETLATPSTPMRKGRIVQRASTDMSISETVSDESPIIITRLSDDSGWTIAGARETLGSPWAWVRRSWTTWRAWKRSVPSSNSITTDERPGIDSDRISLSHATPFNRSASSGTVISCSTSAADRPRASVWTSTIGGRNSGRVSTSVLGIWITPNSVTAAAKTTTSARRCKLVPTNRLVMIARSPGCFFRSRPICPYSPRAKSTGAVSQDSGSDDSMWSDGVASSLIARAPSTLRGQEEAPK